MNTSALRSQHVSTLTDHVSPLRVNYLTNSIDSIQRATLNSLPRPFSQHPSSVPVNSVQCDQMKLRNSNQINTTIIPCLYPLQTSTIITQRCLQQNDNFSRDYHMVNYSIDSIQEVIYEEANIDHHHSNSDTIQQPSYATLCLHPEQDQGQQQQQDNIYSTLKHCESSSGGESVSTPLTSLSSLSTYERAPYCYVFE